MNGWIILASLFVAALGALWLFKVRGPALKFAASAMLLGAAGYALQGNPTYAGSPRQAVLAEPPMPLADLRHAFFGHFTGEESWLSISEALARTGDTAGAVGVLQNAVGKYPGNAQLWIGLGNALVDHGHGLTPPAELAYKRAAELSQGYPAPSFFYGLALARSGDLRGAIAVWRNLLATAPKNASWRPLVERGVAALSAQPAMQR